MSKNRWIFVLLMPLLAMLFVACDDGVSYSEMKDRERDAINDFIISEGISVISKVNFWNRIPLPMWIKTSMSCSIMCMCSL